MMVALLLSLACGAGATGCYLRAGSLRTEAEWLLARGQAQAQEYARSFDGDYADQQMVTFEQRRASLERAQVWLLFEKLLILMAVVGGFASYVLYLIGRLNAQLEDVISDEPAPDMALPPR
jgi:hypothetical protein